MEQPSTSDIFPDHKEVVLPMCLAAATNFMRIDYTMIKATRLI